MIANSLPMKITFISTNQRERKTNETKTKRESISTNECSLIEFSTIVCVLLRRNNNMYVKNAHNFDNRIGKRNLDVRLFSISYHHASPKYYTFSCRFNSIDCFIELSLIIKFISLNKIHFVGLGFFCCFLFV